MTVWKHRTCVVVDGKLLMSVAKQPGNFDTFANHPGKAVWMEVPGGIDRIEQTAKGELVAYGRENGHQVKYALRADPAEGGTLERVEESRG